MLHFAWPWLALLLLLPLAVWRWAPPLRESGTAPLYVPNLQSFDGLDTTRSHARPGWRHGLLMLLWCLLVLAAMRPQWVGEPQQTPTSGRDLMLGVDISGSMQEEDFRYAGRYVPRLAVVRELARQFIAEREGDRIGLILFGEQAYVQTPLTLDRATVQHFLAEATVGLAGKATAIGDAIGLSIKRLRQRPEGSRVLILLTDGANTAGNVEPQEAATSSSFSRRRAVSTSRAPRAANTLASAAPMPSDAPVIHTPRPVSCMRPPPQPGSDPGTR